MSNGVFPLLPTDTPTIPSITEDDGPISTTQDEETVSTTAAGLPTNLMWLISGVIIALLLVLLVVTVVALLLVLFRKRRNNAQVQANHP